MDELAHQPEMDPLEFRLKNLKDPRLRAVLEQRQPGSAGEGETEGLRLRHRRRL